MARSSEWTQRFLARWADLGKRGCCPEHPYDQLALHATLLEYGDTAVGLRNHAAECLPIPAAAYNPSFSNASEHETRHRESQQNSWDAAHDSVHAHSPFNASAAESANSIGNSTANSTDASSEHSQLIETGIVDVPIGLGNYSLASITHSARYSPKAGPLMMPEAAFITQEPAHSSLNEANASQNVSRLPQPHDFDSVPASGLPTETPKTDLGLSTIPLKHSNSLAATVSKLKSMHNMLLTSSGAGSLSGVPSLHLATDPQPAPSLQTSPMQQAVSYPMRSQRISSKLTTWLQRPLTPASTSPTTTPQPGIAG